MSITTKMENLEVNQKSSLKGSKLFGNKAISGYNKFIFKILNDDDISEETKKNPLKFNYLKKLVKLEQKLELTLECTPQQLMSMGDIKTIPDVFDFIDSLLLQIARLRMVIEPEYMTNKQVHTQTLKSYIILRILWLDDSMKKIKKYSVSLGAGDSIKTIDKNTLEQEKKNLNQQLEQLYLDTYK